MDQLRTSHIELQEQMKSLQKAESQARADNQMLREESLMLRDKIVQLIKCVLNVSLIIFRFILNCNYHNNDI